MNSNNQPAENQDDYEDEDKPFGGGMAICDYSSEVDEEEQEDEE